MLQYRMSATECAPRLNDPTVIVFPLRSIKMLAVKAWLCQSNLENPDLEASADDGAYRQL